MEGRKEGREEVERTSNHAGQTGRSYRSGVRRPVGEGEREHAMPVGRNTEAGGSSFPAPIIAQKPRKQIHASTSPSPREYVEPLGAYTCSPPTSSRHRPVTPS